MDDLEDRRSKATPFKVRARRAYTYYRGGCVEKRPIWDSLPEEDRTMLENLLRIDELEFGG